MLIHTTAQIKKVIHTEDFNKRIAQTAQTVGSIECDFKQIKHLDVFNEDIESTGRFFYKKENKIRLDYHTPVNYRIVINENKILTDSDGKKNVMNLKSNKIMKELQGMLMACMSGNLSRMSNYKPEIYEDTGYYLVKVTPIDKNLQTYISRFEINLLKKDMSVSKLRIYESQTNYTDYIFSNQQFNTVIDDSQFAVN